MGNPLETAMQNIVDQRAAPLQVKLDLTRQALEQNTQVLQTLTQALVGRQGGGNAWAPPDAGTGNAQLAALRAELAELNANVRNLIQALHAKGS